MKHYTTIEQSKKLLSLELSPETSDMIAFPESEDNWEFAISMPFKEYKGKKKGAIPCWSLGALLELMPGHSNIYKGDEKDDYKYVCAPISRVKEHYGNTPIEAAYKMIV